MGSNNFGSFSAFSVPSWRNFAECSEAWEVRRRVNGLHNSLRQQRIRWSMKFFEKFLWIIVNIFKEILGHTEDSSREHLNTFYIVSAHIISEEPEGKYGVKEEKFTSLCYAGHLPGYTMSYNHHGLMWVWIIRRSFKNCWWVKFFNHQIYNQHACR